MKIKGFLIAISISMLGLAPPLVASAETPEEVSTLEAPAPITAGNVTYLSGGVGDSEAESIRAIAKDYPLEVVFVQKLNKQEEFLAQVNVQIKDHHHNMMLDITTEGPFLLAKLPQGKYLVVAEHNGVVKQQWVRVGSKKHQKLVFWWPILDSPSLDSPSLDSQ